MCAHRATAKRSFVDTNIWLYAFIETDNDQKRITAKSIVSRSEVVVSTQVINETCVNLLKKALLSEPSIRRLVDAFYAKYTVTSIDHNTLLTASDLREKYSLSYWDSLIVANALCADCEALYTEDIQDGLVVEGKLVIVNPFVL